MSSETARNRRSSRSPLSNVSKTPVVSAAGVFRFPVAAGSIRTRLMSSSGERRLAVTAPAPNGGSVQFLSHIRFRLSGVRPGLRRWRWWIDDPSAGPSTDTSWSTIGCRRRGGAELRPGSTRIARQGTRQRRAYADGSRSPSGEHRLVAARPLFESPGLGIDRWERGCAHDVGCGHKGEAAEQAVA